MSTNTTPNLTNIVENKFLSSIEDEELDAFDNAGGLRSDNYIKLANLYHFQKEFEKEEKILIRFSESVFADSQHLSDVYERIAKISEKRHILEKTLSPNKIENRGLSLATRESEQDKVEISSNKKVKHQNKNTQTSIDGLTIKVLAVCAVYTGRKIEDEIIELSLVLLEYAESRTDPFSIVRTYTGRRHGARPISDDLKLKFKLSDDSINRTPMDKEEILQMFLEANYIVSHSEADIERRHLVTFFPVLKKCKWYSTQKDIPWKALGFESTALTDIMKSLGRRKPRTSSERAKAICHLLQHKESSNKDPLIERVHYMKPMKEIEWTDEMEEQHNKMTKQQNENSNVFIWISTIAVAGLGLSKYLNFW